jgi:serine/threonine-protein kinase CHEK2
MSQGSSEEHQEEVQKSQKPRRSERLASQTGAETAAATTPIKNTYLPTPLTHHDSTATDIQKAVTATPEVQRTPSSDDLLPAFSSPPGDTQAFSQFVYPPRAFADDVEDEAAEGVWGYLIPLDGKAGHALVLKKRNSCEGDSCGPTDREQTSSPSKSSKRQLKSPLRPESVKSPKPSPKGYIIGRHPECGRFIFLSDKVAWY